MSPEKPTPYAQLGGDAAIRLLVDHFYDRMDAWPEAAGIRAMHPADLTASREKLFDFLCGWLGGPPRYMMKHGHPRLRARHLPFAIGTAEAEAWMACMRFALAEVVADDAMRVGLELSLERLADHMRNQHEDPSASA
jgi:hemoglobin